MNCTDHNICESKTYNGSSVEAKKGGGWYCDVLCGAAPPEGGQSSPEATPQ